MPRPGDSLLQRITEVRDVGKALAHASTVLLSGGGLIGVEIAADIRLRHPHLERLYLLCRAGAPLADDPDIPQATRDHVRAGPARVDASMPRVGQGG